jgi:hypothetical protein
MLQVRIVRKRSTEGLSKRSYRISLLLSSCVGVSGRSSYSCRFAGRSAMLYIYLGRCIVLDDSEYTRKGRWKVNNLTRVSSRLRFGQISVMFTTGPSTPIDCLL